MQNTDDICKLFEMLRSKHGIFCIDTIRQLETFYAGWSYARYEKGIERSEMQIAFEMEFDEWLKNELDLKNIYPRWSHIILMFSGSEYLALKYFYEMFDHFVEHKQSQNREDALVSETKEIVESENS